VTLNNVGIINVERIETRVTSAESFVESNANERAVSGTNGMPTEKSRIEAKKRVNCR